MTIMNMKNETFFGTDTLLAFRLLKHILSSNAETDMFRAVSNDAVDEWTERARQEALLWDILWGDIVFGGKGSVHDRYHQRPPLPLSQFLHWSGHFPALDGMKCRLSLVEQDVGLYMQTRAFQLQADSERKLFEKLRAKEILVLPLSEVRELAIDLVDGRQDLVLPNSAIASDDLREKYRPVIFDFPPFGKALLPLIDKELERQAALFRQGRSGDKQKLLKWRKQRERMLNILKPMSQNYTELWCSSEDFMTGAMQDGARPVETLLAMEAEGELNIESIAASGDNDVKLRVDMRLESWKKLSDEENDVNETEWVEVADFEIRQKPLALRMRDGTEYGIKNENGKATAIDVKRRKALKVLAAFAPQPGQRVRNIFTDLPSLARKIPGVSAETAKSHLSIARWFLDQIGSTFTLTDARHKDGIKLEEQEKLPRRTKTRLPERSSVKMRRES